MNKYTVIFTRRWQSGSHWHALTKAKRVEVKCESTNPNLFAKMVEQVGTEDIQYIFEGWPKMVGEGEGDIL